MHVLNKKPDLSLGAGSQQFTTRFIRETLGVVPLPPRRQQKTEILERLNGGRRRIERRNGAANLYASAYLQGRNMVRSTGEDTPGAARKVALAWYLEQLDRIRRGEQLHGKTFAECADAFLQHADSVREVSEGQRRNYRQKSFTPF